MKTLGRILVILSAFVLVIGVTYMVVNANSSSTTSPEFEQGTEGFPQSVGQEPPFANGERPDLESRDGDWLFGLVKNVGIIAITVTLVALPKRLLGGKPLPVRAG